MLEAGRPKVARERTKDRPEHSKVTTKFVSVLPSYVGRRPSSHLITTSSGSFGLVPAPVVERGNSHLDLAQQAPDLPKRANRGRGPL